MINKQDIISYEKSDKKRNIRDSSTIYRQL